ncbi:hypothetical protein FRB90_005965 [Tulasnella sp. 427]|nr:hypothetical protein FRB90_005965 [Tulasnella sp. 427]
MLPTLFLPLLAALPSATASPWTQFGNKPAKSRRGVDEVWGGYNITAAALEIRDSISSPTCNKTASCQQVITVVVPRCLGLQGSAGCWCGLEDPIHYCAICMLSPTDNTTSAAQTQSATEGHMAFHEGCAAYAVSLNSSATMSMDGMTMDMPSSTASATPSMTDLPAATSSAAANDASAVHKHNSTGPIVGGVVGGILGLLLIAVGGYLGWRYLQSKNTHATPYQDGPGGDQMVQHTPTPYYGPGGGDVKTSAYFNNNTVPQSPQQQPVDLMTNRLSYASNHPQAFPYSPAVSSPQGPFPGSASKDYDTSMFATLGPHASPPPSQFGNSNSSGGASQGPLVLHGTGGTWTTNPVTPPPPFAPSTSPGLPPGARGPETGRAAGYTSGVPEAMTLESERR